MLETFSVNPDFIKTIIQKYWSMSPESWLCLDMYGNTGIFWLSSFGKMRRCSNTLSSLLPPAYDGSEKALLHSEFELPSQ